MLVFGRVKIEELIFHISFKIADSNPAPSVVPFLNDCDRASIVIFAERRAVRRFFRAQIQSIRRNRIMNLRSRIAVVVIARPLIQHRAVSRYKPGIFPNLNVPPFRRKAQKRHRFAIAMHFIRSVYIAGLIKLPRAACGGIRRHCGRNRLRVVILQICLHHIPFGNSAIADSNANPSVVQLFKNLNPNAVVILAQRFRFLVRRSAQIQPVCGVRIMHDRIGVAAIRPSRTTSEHQAHQKQSENSDAFHRFIRLSSQNVQCRTPDTASSSIIKTHVPSIFFPENQKSPLFRGSCGLLP